MSMRWSPFIKPFGARHCANKVRGLFAFSRVLNKDINLEEEADWTLAGSASKYQSTSYPRGNQIHTRLSYAFPLHIIIDPCVISYYTVGFPSPFAGQSFDCKRDIARKKRQKKELHVEDECFILGISKESFFPLPKCFLWKNFVSNPDSNRGLFRLSIYLGRPMYLRLLVEVARIWYWMQAGHRSDCYSDPSWPFGPLADKERIKQRIILEAQDI